MLVDLSLYMSFRKVLACTIHTYDKSLIFHFHTISAANIKEISCPKIICQLPYCDVLICVGVGVPETDKVFPLQVTPLRKDQSLKTKVVSL